MYSLIVAIIKRYQKHSLLKRPGLPFAKAQDKPVFGKRKKLSIELLMACSSFHII